VILLKGLIKIKQAFLQAANESYLAKGLIRVCSWKPLCTAFGDQCTHGSRGKWN